MKKFAWLLYFLVSATFISLFLIANSLIEMTTPNFWGGLIWIQALITLGFLINAKVFSSFGDTTRNSPKVFGILWSFDLSLLLVSVGSGLLVILFLLISENFLANTLFWILQILLISISSFVLIFLYMTTKFASTGAEHLPTIQDLKNTIKKIENLAIEKLNDDGLEIGKLYEEVSFRMPHPSKIEEGKYLGFYQKLKKLLEDIETVSQEDFTNQVKSLRTTAQIL